MSEFKIKSIKCTFVIDGFHIRAGFRKKKSIWPNTVQISEIIENIIAGVGDKIGEWADVESQISSWIYCDAVLSITDEEEIKCFVEKQESLPNDIERQELGFDLARYVDARAIFAESQNEEFSENSVIKDLEVKRGDWIKYPPRQSGVDTVIATEIIVAAREAGIIVIVSSDSGFGYTVRKLREIGFNLAVGNVNYSASGTGSILKEECSAYFLADIAGDIVDASCKPNTKFAGEYLQLSIKPDDGS